jgi:phosphatidylinositol glycan class B
VSGRKHSNCFFSAFPAAAFERFTKTKFLSAFLSVCRAQVHVLQLIGEEAAAAGDDLASVLFLTPCHATPYSTHVHRPIRMRFLDCSPRQHAAATARLNEEAQGWLALPMSCQGVGANADASQRDCFESGPAEYLNAVLGSMPLVQRPRMLVGFAPLMLRVSPLLHHFGYTLQARLTNCWVQTDENSPCELHLWSL